MSLLERLAPLTAQLEISPQPGVYKIANIQHLLTPVRGRLLEALGVLPVAAALHPTPALGGKPRALAMAFIQQVEPVPRGWYAAPVGWIDVHMDGAFAVAIRSAIAQERRVWLYAGAGIVADSEPDKEWEETALKFRPMLEALGVEKAMNASPSAIRRPYGPAPSPGAGGAACSTFAWRPARARRRSCWRAAHPVLRIWRHLDERSAAYFALGIGQATNRPAALLATSGTATANFFPAVVEARMAGVPLLVITADRPPELRHSGANQTIDQVKLYGDQVLWSVDLPLPEAEAPELALRNLKALVARAAATAGGLAPGPVHLNAPFRKPFEPLDEQPAAREEPAAPALQITRGQLLPTEAQATLLGSMVADNPRGASSSWGRAGSKTTALPRR